jgi:hypothetical protein
MTGEPQAGHEAGPPTLFDQDDATDPTPTGGRRLAARSVGAALNPIDPVMGPVGPVGHVEATSDWTVPAPLAMPPAGQPGVDGPPAYPHPSPEPAVALDRPRPPPPEPALPVPLPPVAPTAPLLAGPLASAGLMPAVTPPGARLVEAAPIDVATPDTVTSLSPAIGLTPTIAGISPTIAGMPPAIVGPDLRRPLVRPVPARGRSGPQPRKTERRPSFRGSRRLADRIGIWRKLLSFIELVIVVAVLGALLAAVIGIFIGAIVVALQKALNG